MTSLSDEEWKGVQEALVIGGLRACIDDILTSRFRHTCPVAVNDKNRRIIEQAYDDGEGNTVTLVPTNDWPWFAAMWEDHEVMQGVEYDDTLYSIVTLSGGGLVSVIVGRGLIENEMGMAFPGFVEAKAYVQGLTAK